MSALARPIRYLSVCSGVGGLDYGLDRCGWEPVAMCEAAPYPRRILARHWPDVPVFTDMMTLRAADLPGPVDAVVGGIPCQPFSTAGKQVGTDDPRHLWPHFLRLMLETGAPLGLVENVRGLLTAQDGHAFATILREATAAGYTVEWQILAAGTLGAPHIRQRVFLVLHRDGAWTWPGARQVGLFGTSPWAAIAPPSDGWPVSGRATGDGWAPAPWAYPHPAVWPWEVGRDGMVPTPMGYGRSDCNEAGTTVLERTVRGMTEGGDRGVRRAPSGMLPTPANADGERESATFGRGNQTLAGAARAVLPTPAARDWRDGRASEATMDRNARPLNEVVTAQHGGGKLRPQPVEWMMSWPDGWTLPGGPSLRHEEPQAWLDWPACDWTTTEKEPHRRDRLKGCGNGVVGVVGEAIGRAVSATWQRARGAA